MSIPPGHISNRLWILRRRINHSGVQVSQQSGRLLGRQLESKGRHHSFACLQDALYLGIRCRFTAGQRGMVEDSVQVWRRRPQTQIVVLVAMSAANLVDLLPFRLLRGERGF